MTTTLTFCRQVTVVTMSTYSLTLTTTCNDVTVLEDFLEI